MIRYMKIGEICDILNGYAFKSSRYINNKGIRVIRITNVQKGYIEDAEPKFYPEKETNEIKKFMLEDGDLLISLTGNVGRVALIDKSMLPAALNQRVGCIRVNKKDLIYKPYLYHLLNSDYFEKQCINSSNGIAQKNMSTEWLKEYHIPVYSMDYQKKIATIFDKIDIVIKKHYKQIEILDKIVKSLFIEMFGDPIYNSKNWQVVQIGDIAKDVRYGTSNPAVEGGKYPYLRMNNITVDGKLDLGDLKYIDISDYELEKYVVRKGDLLFNRTNSIELVGKTTTFNLNEDMIIAGYIIRVRLNNQMLPEVLSQYMNLEVIKSKLRDMAKGAVNQANINAQELQSIRVYLPDIDIQKKFVKIKCKLDKSKYSSFSHLSA